MSSEDDYVLVYVENTDIRSNVEGYTHRGKIVDTQGDNYTILIENTYPFISFDTVTVTSESIVSWRDYRTFGNSFYHKYEIDEVEKRKLIVASNFVKKSDSNSLSSGSESELGSGIFGFKEKLEGTTRITVSSPLFIQDKEHGESITSASSYTNRLLQRPANEGNISWIPTHEESEILWYVWSLVLERVNVIIPKNIFKKKSEKACRSFLNAYSSDSYYDSYIGETEPIAELPINFIMRELSYNGLVSDDSFNNDWNRGCVSYDLDKASIFVSGKSEYN